MIRQPGSHKDVLKFPRMIDRIVFMGSPDFAVPALQKLAEKFTVVGVVTQPDRPAGRGRELSTPPVKDLAIRLGLPVYQPDNLRNEEAVKQLSDWAPTAFIVVAFGQILSKRVLSLPRLGCINIHGSILPRWRGASPIHSAILAGDAETGVTIMKMDSGVDTGDIYAIRRELIRPEDTTETLGDRLSLIGADLLVDTLPQILSGQLKGSGQDHLLATYAGRIEKADGILDFHQPAVSLERRVRAFNPWPSTSFQWNGQVIKVHAAHVFPEGKTIPGERQVVTNLPAIGTASGWLILDVVQPAGKKKISGSDFLRGARGWSSNEN